jgi:hypothetical protein
MTEPRPPDKGEVGPKPLQASEPEEYQRFERLARRVLSVPRPEKDRQQQPKHA